MTAMLAPDTRPIIPDDIAKIVVSPKSYTDDALVYGAFRWLRENMPLGVAELRRRMRFRP